MAGLLTISHPENVLRTEPNATPKGYSYFEDFPRELNNNKHPSDDAIATVLREATVDLILQGNYARHATTVVQKGVGTLYKTPIGKTLINGVASTSLGKSVQGAAAISHVSKIVRSHGISNFGVMVFNDGKLLIRYCKGDISGAEFGNGLFVETMGQSGDMLGWMIGASIAASCLCGPVGAAAIAMFGSAVGRSIGQSLARAAAKE